MKAKLEKLKHSAKNEHGTTRRTKAMRSYFKDTYMCVVMYVVACCPHVRHGETSNCIQSLNTYSTCYPDQAIGREQSGAQEVEEAKVEARSSTRKRTREASAMCTDLSVAPTPRRLRKPPWVFDAQCVWDCIHA